MTRVLVTGMAGFIGSHMAEGLLRDTDWDVVAIDRLDETSTLLRLGETDAYRQHRKRVTMLWHNLRAPINDTVASAIGPVDYIIHLAASTHVDRSISQPMEFVADNVVGTGHVLEFARRIDDLKMFVQFSTDEVFGAAAPGVAFKEDDRYRSGNPYAATKAGAEELAMAYNNTYRLPVVVVHAMNNFGERQHVEKFVPLVCRRVLQGEQVLIHTDPTGTHAAVRGWLHARNTWSAVHHLLQHGAAGQKYNLGGEREVDCLTMAKTIAEILDHRLDYEMVDYHSSRPGHDLRYALDSSKLRAMGFAYPRTFDESLAKTVRWYAAHPRWLGL